MSQDRFQQALKIVQSQTKKAIFETWFSRLQLLTVSEDVATIGTPNRFVKEWIEESELIHILAAGLKEAFEKPLTPGLVITEREKTGAFDRSKIARPPKLSSQSPVDHSVKNAPSPTTAVHGRELPGFLGSPSHKAMSGVAPSPSTATLRTNLRLPAANHKPPESSSYGLVTPLMNPDANWSVPLKRDYIFENYVVGPSNRLSHAAALAVAQKPGQAYNPLFIHSASGLGKTHLLQAVCAELLKIEPQPVILYLSCEDFVNQFIEGVKDNELEVFRSKFRNVDMLLIDDIHFLADKPRIQEEFFHTFNSLYNSQKQIVLSADCHPSEIPTLQERLVSRFKWGLVSRIDPPEYETRAAIIKKKSLIKGTELTDDVVAMLAARITTNIREVEGALNRLLGSARLLHKKIDKSFVLEVLADLMGETHQYVKLTDILGAAEAHFGVKLSALKSKKRTKRIAYARQICMYLARELTELTLQDIGQELGGRDHTTVLYAVDKITKELNTDSELNKELQNLSRSVRQRAATSVNFS